MAGKIYKSISAGDKVNKKDLLHEAIPITGSLCSGTYGGSTVALGSEPHIKTYSHGMFQSVYDYPYLSSSSNHLFDITCGFSSDSTLSASSPGTQQAKKINIYNQMAQVLAGHNSDGTIREFDEDGDLTGGTKIRECYFLNFSRLLIKDEIKKGSFSLEVGVNSGYAQGQANFGQRIKITDASGSDGYKVNSPAGEYGVLFAQSTRDGDATLSTEMIENESISGGSSVSTSNPACGLIYYQAGIAVISGSTFHRHDDGGILTTAVGATRMQNVPDNAGFNFITGSNIDTISNGIRNRIYNVSFNNTTELNSMIYFCRTSHNEFNYSSNPTYVSGSKIQVKDVAVDTPVTYVTSVGLYGPQKQLLAVAKLSEPIKKTPENEVTFRVRLDY